MPGRLPVTTSTPDPSGQANASSSTRSNIRRRPFRRYEPDTEADLGPNRRSTNVSARAARLSGLARGRTPSPSPPNLSSLPRLVESNSSLGSSSDSDSGSSWGSDDDDSDLTSGSSGLSSDDESIRDVRTQNTSGGDGPVSNPRVPSCMGTVVQRNLSLPRAVSSDCFRMFHRSKDYATACLDACYADDYDDTFNSNAVCVRVLHEICSAGSPTLAQLQLIDDNLQRLSPAVVPTFCRIVRALNPPIFPRVRVKDVVLAALFADTINRPAKRSDLSAAPRSEPEEVWFAVATIRADPTVADKENAFARISEASSSLLSADLPELQPAMIACGVAGIPADGIVAALDLLEGKSNAAVLGGDLLRVTKTDVGGDLPFFCGEFATPFGIELLLASYAYCFVDSPPANDLFELVEEWNDVDSLPSPRLYFHSWAPTDLYACGGLCFYDGGGVAISTGTFDASLHAAGTGAGTGAFVHAFDIARAACVGLLLRFVAEQVNVGDGGAYDPNPFVVNRALAKMGIRFEALDPIMTDLDVGSAISWVRGSQCTAEEASSIVNALVNELFTARADGLRRKEMLQIVVDECGSEDAGGDANLSAASSDLVSKIAASAKFCATALMCSPTPPPFFFWKQLSWDANETFSVTSAEGLRCWMHICGDGTPDPSADSSIPPDDNLSTSELSRSLSASLLRMDYETPSRAWAVIRHEDELGASFSWFKSQYDHFKCASSVEWAAQDTFRPYSDTIADIAQTQFPPYQDITPGTSVYVWALTKIISVLLTSAEITAYNIITESYFSKSLVQFLSMPFHNEDEGWGDIFADGYTNGDIKEVLNAFIEAEVACPKKESWFPEDPVYFNGTVSQKLVTDAESAASLAHEREINALTDLIEAHRIEFDASLAEQKASIASLEANVTSFRAKYVKDEKEVAVQLAEMKRTVSTIDSSTKSQIAAIRAAQKAETAAITAKLDKLMGIDTELKAWKAGLAKTEASITDSVMNELRKVEKLLSDKMERDVSNAFDIRVSSVMTENIKALQAVTGRLGVVSNQIKGFERRLAAAETKEVGVDQGASMATGATLASFGVQLAAFDRKLNNIKEVPAPDPVVQEQNRARAQAVLAAATKAEAAKAAVLDQVQEITRMLTGIESNAALIAESTDMAARIAFESEQLLTTATDFVSAVQSAHTEDLAEINRIKEAVTAEVVKLREKQAAFDASNQTVETLQRNADRNRETFTEAITAAASYQQVADGLTRNFAILKAQVAQLQSQIATNATETTQSDNTITAQLEVYTAQLKSQLKQLSEDLERSIGRGTEDGIGVITASIEELRAALEIHITDGQGQLTAKIMELQTHLEDYSRLKIEAAVATFVESQTAVTDALDTRLSALEARYNPSSPGPDFRRISDEDFRNRDTPSAAPYGPDGGGGRADGLLTPREPRNPPSGPTTRIKLGGILKGLERKIGATAITPERLLGYAHDVKIDKAVHLYLVQRLCNKEWVWEDYDGDAYSTAKSRLDGNIASHRDLRGQYADPIRGLFDAFSFDHARTKNNQKKYEKQYNKVLKDRYLPMERGRAMEICNAVKFISSSLTGKPQIDERTVLGTEKEWTYAACVDGFDASRDASSIKERRDEVSRAFENRANVLVTLGKSRPKVKLRVYGGGARTQADSEAAIQYSLLWRLERLVTSLNMWAWRFMLEVQRTLDTKKSTTTRDFNSAVSEGHWMSGGISQQKLAWWVNFAPGPVRDVLCDWFSCLRMKNNDLLSEIEKTRFRHIPTTIPLPSRSGMTIKVLKLFEVFRDMCLEDNSAILSEGTSIETAVADNMCVLRLTDMWKSRQLGPVELTGVERWAVIHLVAAVLGTTTSKRHLKSYLGNSDIHSFTALDTTKGTGITDVDASTKTFSVVGTLGFWRAFTDASAVNTRKGLIRALFSQDNDNQIRLPFWMNRKRGAITQSVVSEVKYRSQTRSAAGTNTGLFTAATPAADDAGTYASRRAEDWMYKICLEIVDSDKFVGALRVRSPSQGEIDLAFNIADKILWRDSGSYASRYEHFVEDADLRSGRNAARGTRRRRLVGTSAEAPGLFKTAFDDAIINSFSSSLTDLPDGMSDQEENELLAGFRWYFLKTQFGMDTHKWTLRFVADMRRTRAYMKRSEEWRGPIFLSQPIKDANVAMLLLACKNSAPLLNRLDHVQGGGGAVNSTLFATTPRRNDTHTDVQEIDMPSSYFPSSEFSLYRAENNPFTRLLVHAARMEEIAEEDGIAPSPENPSPIKKKLEFETPRSADSAEGGGAAASF